MKFAYFLHRLLIGFIGCGSLHTAKTLKEKIGKTNLYAHVKTVFRIIHISFQKILYTYQKNLLFDINTNIIKYVTIVWRKIDEYPCCIYSFRVNDVREINTMWPKSLWSWICFNIKHKNDICIVRESNPGRPRGRRAFYHWTNDAFLLLWPNINFPIHRSS